MGRDLCDLKIPQVAEGRGVGGLGAKGEEIEKYILVVTE